MKAIGKRELVLLAVVALIVSAGFLTTRIFFSAPGSTVEVAVIDEQSKKTVLKTFSLAEDTAYTIVTETGTNHMIIQDGAVWISEADCPNQDCVQKGKIHQNGEMLVCLPHRVTISIIGE